MARLPVTLRPTRRQLVIAAAAVVVIGGSTVALATTAPANYVVTAHAVVAGPDLDHIAPQNNALLQHVPSTQIIGRSLVANVSQGSAARDIDLPPDASYGVSLADGLYEPIVVVTVNASEAATASGVAHRLVRYLGKQVVSLQSAAGSPTNQVAKLVTLDPPGRPARQWWPVYERGIQAILGWFVLVLIARRIRRQLPRNKPVAVGAVGGELALMRR